MSRFDYVKYDEETQKLQADFKRMFELVAAPIEQLPQGRPQSIALTKLEECYMWVGKALRDMQIKARGAVEQPERKDG
jgi:hypothetical protein